MNKLKFAAFNIIFAVILFIVGQASHAAGFNCKNAKTKIEKLICADLTLSADDDGLARQCIGFEAREEGDAIRDVSRRGEFAVHGVLEHDVLDDVGLTDVQCLGLLRDLLVDERRAHEARADHVGPYAPCAAFLGDDARQTK